MLSNPHINHDIEQVEAKQDDLTTLQTTTNDQQQEEVQQALLPHGRQQSQLQHHYQQQNISPSAISSPFQLFQQQQQLPYPTIADILQHNIGNDVLNYSNNININATAPTIINHGDTLNALMSLIFLSQQQQPNASLDQNTSNSTSRENHNDPISAQQQASALLSPQPNARRLESTTTATPPTTNALSQLLHLSILHQHHQQQQQQRQHLLIQQIINGLNEMNSSISLQQSSNQQDPSLRPPSNTSNHDNIQSLIMAVNSLTEAVRNQNITIDTNPTTRRRGGSSTSFANNNNNNSNTPTQQQQQQQQQLQQQQHISNNTPSIQNITDLILLLQILVSSLQKR